jgi:hypothetical protein
MTEDATADTGAAPPPPPNRRVLVRHGVNLPGSTIIIRDQTYTVDSDRAIAVGSDVTDEEIAQVGVLA